MLAGLFKAPTKFSPLVNLPAARARANVVLDNLVDNGFMTEGQVYGARRNPATPIDRTAEDAPNYYLDFAFDEMRKLVDTFPKSVTDRYFVVRTALDFEYAALRRARNRIRVAPIRPRLRRQPVGGGVRRSRRRYPRHDRRPRLRRQPVQPRDRRAAPARLVVQALRLCHRIGQRLHAQHRRRSILRSASAIGARTIIPAAIPAR